MPLPDLEIPMARARAQVLYDALRRAILDRSLEPGERLIELAIAEAYGVSRTPVREALHKLSADGLVADVGRGMVVAAFNEEEIVNICAVREVLEGMAARLAAKSRSDIEVMQLRRVLSDMELATQAGDVERLTTLSHAFHETIAQAARNTYLARQLLFLQSLIERVTDTSFRSPERPVEALAEHQAIVDAIAGQDHEEAQRLSESHFRTIMATRLINRKIDAPLP